MDSEYSSKDLEIQKNKQMLEYDNIEERLKQIEEKVLDENINMEDALKLYEEAVNLGMKASVTVENNALINATTNEVVDNSNNKEK